MKENWIKRLKRKAHELLKGENAYISKKRQSEMKLQHMRENSKPKTKKKTKPKPKSKPKRAYTTSHTKDVMTGLKQSGLTDKEIARLRGKK